MGEPGALPETALCKIVLGVKVAEFMSDKDNALKETVEAILVTVLICAAVCAIIWLGILQYDEDELDGFAIFCYIVVLFFALKARIKVIKNCIEKYSDAKESFICSLSEEEKEEYLRREKRHRITRKVCLGSVLCIVIVVFIAGRIRLDQTYSKAEELILSGQYEEATELLHQIEDKKYKSTSALLLLCKAKQEYEKGWFYDAYYTMEDVYIFCWDGSLDEEISSETQSFKADLRDKYDQYWEEMEQQWQKEYENKIQDNVPYVGMRESEIANTSLGKPSDDVVHNTEVKNGKILPAAVYYFHKGEYTIFSARCVDGVVTEVTDHRENPIPKFEREEKKIESHEPSVDGFSDPEDFYDWYWDDFFDYYDAEDYYYEHGGK